MISVRRWLSQTYSKNQKLSHGSKHPTAGIIVIGDEILKAQVKDTNSFYACRLLYKHGIKTKKISIVGDDIRDIAAEINRFSRRYAYVITSGGVGPTHDDVTYEALANAFHDSLHYHPTLVNIVRNDFGYKEMCSPAFKMAHVPTGATLKFAVNNVTGKSLSYPCIVLKNVHVFPGSPLFFEMSFGSLCKNLFSGNTSFATAEIYINAAEETFANALSLVAMEYPNVSFGSYPERNRYYKARITIESDNMGATEDAKQRFCALIPPHILVNYDREPEADCVEKYQNFLERTERRGIYERTIDRLIKYYQSPELVLLHINGSMQSVVLIHLARVASEKVCPQRKLHAIYIERDHFRAETKQFVDSIVKRYNVELLTLPRQSDLRQTIKDSNLFSTGTRLLIGERLVRHRDDASHSNPVSTGSSDYLETHYPLAEWTYADIENMAIALSLPSMTSPEGR